MCLHTHRRTSAFRHTYTRTHTPTHTTPSSVIARRIVRDVDAVVIDGFLEIFEEIEAYRGQKCERVRAVRYLRRETLLRLGYELPKSKV